MLVDYLSNIKNVPELCDRLESDVLKFFFKDGGKNESDIDNYPWTSLYRSAFAPIWACVQLCELLKLEVLRSHQREILLSANALQIPRDIPKLEDFRVHLYYIKSAFLLAGEEILNLCSAFDDEEKMRINEAIHDYFEDCTYSCVAMSVSAVESRLLKLMCLVSPDSKQKLEKKTLGQLVNEYLKNKSKYKTVVPNKHDHLLQLCNTYRIFSVHPKKQKIKLTVASSILTLAIDFLTDQDTKPEVVKAKLTA
jgi:hypothetical protein